MRERCRRCHNLIECEACYQCADPQCNDGCVFCRPEQHRREIVLLVAAIVAIGIAVLVFAPLL